MTEPNEPQTADDPVEPEESVEAKTPEQDPKSREEKKRLVMVMLVALLMVLGMLAYIKFVVNEPGDQAGADGGAEGNQVAKDLWQPMDSRRRKDTRYARLGPKMKELFLPIKGINEQQKDVLGLWLSQWTDLNREELKEAWTSYWQDHTRPSVGLGGDMPEGPAYPVVYDQRLARLMLSFEPHALIESEGEFWLRVFRMEGNQPVFLYLKPRFSDAEWMAMQKRIGYQWYKSSEIPRDWQAEQLPILGPQFNSLKQTRPGVSGGFIPVTRWQRLSQHEHYEQGAIVVFEAREEMGLLDEPEDEVKPAKGFKDYPGIEPWKDAITVFRALNGDMLLYQGKPVPKGTHPESAVKPGSVVWISRRHMKLREVEGGWDAFLKLFVEQAKQGKLVSGGTRLERVE